MSICKICGGEYSRIRLHLKSHDIDPMDYWVNYISETKEYPKCKFCGKPISHFINDSFECGPGIYCSKECMDADLPNVLRERHANGIYEGTSYLTTQWNHDIYSRLDSLARTAYHRLFRDIDPLSEGYFYIVILENETLKIGASRQNLDYYIDLRYHYFNYEVLRRFKSTLLNCAKIEYLIKTDERFTKYLVEGYSSNTEEFSMELKDYLLDFVDRIPFFSKI